MKILALKKFIRQHVTIVRAKRKKNAVKNIRKKEFIVKNVPNYNPFLVICNMIRIFNFAFMLLSFSLFGQEKSDFSLAFKFAYHPQDFFFHAQASFVKNNLYQGVNAGFGINKTLFQQRFNPRLSYEIGYQLPLFKSVSLQAALQIGGSTLNLSTPTVRNHTYQNEFCGLIRSIFGNKHAALVGVGIGPAFEYKRVHNNRYKAFFFWSYFVEIGYRYVF